MVTVLRLAYDYDCESLLGQELLQAALAGNLPSRQQLQARFLPRHSHLDPATTQHSLSGYDQLLRHASKAVQVAQVHHG